MNIFLGKKQNTTKVYKDYCSKELFLTTAYDQIAGDDYHLGKGKTS